MTPPIKFRDLQLALYKLKDQDDTTSLGSRGEFYSVIN